MRAPPLSKALGVVATCVALTGCFQYRKVAVKPVNPRATVVVQSPVRAHLTDGSTVLFPRGFVLHGDTAVGTAARYAAGSSNAVGISGIVLDSVVGMETFETEIREGKTFLVSTVATVVTVAGSIGLLKAIFGSCPTFYSDSAGVSTLEAEGFSYSIAPLFEHRDLHRLRSTAVRNGIVSLEVRNEALETHYINHLELLDVAGAPDEYVTPDNRERPLALRGLRPAVSAVDRAGRNVLKTLELADGDLFGTDSLTLARAGAGDLDDYIDLEVENPSSADTVVLALRLRNSLLNTVLLYDQILGDPGAASLDWIGRDIKRIANALEMGKWYSSHMGMRVAVRSGNAYTTVAHIADAGPIAFHDVAVAIPVPRDAKGGRVGVRLSFVADQWRIDQIQVASSYRRPRYQSVAVSDVVTPDPSQADRARRELARADGNYLVTVPSQTFTVRFAVGDDASQHHTYLLAAQGYYSEWVRGSWIKSASGRPFRTNDEALVAALNSWRSKRGVLERDFYTSRIATR